MLFFFRLIEIVVFFYCDLVSFLSFVQQQQLVFFLSHQTNRQTRMKNNERLLENFVRMKYVRRERHPERETYFIRNVQRDRTKPVDLKSIILIRWIEITWSTTTTSKRKEKKTENNRWLFERKFVLPKVRSSNPTSIGCGYIWHKSTTTWKSTTSETTIHATWWSICWWHTRSISSLFSDLNRDGSCSFNTVEFQLVYFYLTSFK